MTYLLDTCALSEFTKPKPSASVDAWFAQIPDGAALLVAGGGTKALDWLRANLLGPVAGAKRDLRVTDPRMSGEDVLEIQHKLTALGHRSV